jgi:hypothetical protein
MKLHEGLIAMSVNVVTERHTPVSVTLKAEDVIGLVARALLVEVR